MTWTTAFGDHIIEKHIYSIWILCFCFVEIYVFVGSPLPGATFLAGPQSWLLSNRNCVPSTISTSLAPTPDRFLCFAEENVVNMMRWWGWWSWWWGWWSWWWGWWSLWRGWWSWWWRRCSLWWGWWRWWSRKWFHFSLQTFATAFFCLFCCGPPGSYWVSTDVYVLTLCMCIIDLPIVLIDSSSEWTSNNVFIIFELR